MHHDEAVRDSFIAGLRSPYIRQRLLENDNLTLDVAFTTARSLEVAQKNSETYAPLTPSCAAVEPKQVEHRTRPPESEPPEPLMAATRFNRDRQSKCFYCGYTYHPRFKCPAKDITCSKCQKKGHYARVCRGNPMSVPDKVTAATYGSPQPLPDYQPPEFQPQPDASTSWPPASSALWAISSVSTPSCSASPNHFTPHPLSQSMTNIEVNQQPVVGVADSASSFSFIHPDCVKSLGLEALPTEDRPKISMASKSLMTEVTFYCEAELRVKDRSYKNFRFLILPNLCTNLILGLDFLSQHESITMNYGGKQPPLTVCGLSTIKTDPPSLFSNLTPNCRPVADGRRNYSKDDLEFISQEVDRMMGEGIIEPSKSPWRAQIVVVKKGEKKRLAVDYSQTINLYTQLDAYPLPLISDIINQIAQYRVFSTIDLRHAYHQIELKPDDKPYTAFEAKGRLYQFRRVPFGVTNGVSIFQREMDKMVDKYHLKATYPYLDNITICGKTPAEHDANLAKFLSAANDLNLTYNEDKCEFNTSKLSLLGCVIENGEIRPDPERMRALESLPPPHDTKSLKRCLGFFSYYAKWVPCFSEKAKPLAQTTTFPISQEAQKSLTNMKADIKNAVVCCIDESIPFQVECDASEHAIAATLNQQGRPVAFFSRTLQHHEMLHPSVEKEAMAIIESIRKWRHLLAPRHFTLVTDQKSISFMFNNQQKSKKIKNEKILRWRIELSTYNYTIKYRPGRLNESPDALSRICASSPSVDLRTLHQELCHPGVTRLLHFVKSRNLPFSVEEIRSVVRSCPVCLECKPNFYRPPQPAHLIKSTRPFERLNVDFKGPLPSTNKNTFFLNVIDEFSRFPWVFPCSNVTAETVSRCFVQLFTMFGLPSYIHSDRGSAFMSAELRGFLSSRGVASSRTTAYNSAGNGQIERENQTIWKAITLALKSKGLPISRWQEVLPEVLHATRSLLCTATNATPHDRIFSFPRKSTTGPSLPDWLLKPGPVWLKRHPRGRKTDPLVESVDLLHANPEFAFIRYQDGRENTVSLRDLAPAPESVPLVEETQLQPRSPTPVLIPPSVTSPSGPPVQPVDTPPSPAAVKESTARPAEIANLPARELTPVMGQSGGKWCNVSQDNVLSGNKRDRR